MAEKEKVTTAEAPAPKAKKEEFVIAVVFTDGSRESVQTSGKYDDAVKAAKAISNDGFEKEVDGGVNFYPASQIKRVTVRTATE